jgi:hypothetical protein
VVAGVIGILGYREFADEKIRQNTAKLYPVGAANFIESQGYVGPLFNHFDWGGYLLWRLPHIKVSMDGRGNVHGDDRVKKSVGTWNGGSHWSDDLDLNAAEIVIVQKDMALAALLRLDPRFHMAYQDEIAVVFVRVRSGASQSNLQPPESLAPPSVATNVASVQ